MKETVLFLMISESYCLVRSSIRNIRHIILELPSRKITFSRDWTKHRVKVEALFEANEGSRFEYLD